MRVQEVETGLWRWTALHPDWTSDQDWGPEVGCVYAETADAVVLFDPLVPPGDEDRFWQALDRDVERVGQPVHALLTVHWHHRSANAVRERYGAEIWAHESVLHDEPREIEPTRTFAFGETLPGGVVAHDAVCFLEAVFWLPAYRALVFGDIVSSPAGSLTLCPESWLGEGAGHVELRAALWPLLELPVRHVLVSHGEPVLGDGHTALADLLEPHASAPSAA
jgi:hypothetical protein